MAFKITAQEKELILRRRKIQGRSKRDLHDTTQALRKLLSAYFEMKRVQRVAREKLSKLRTHPPGFSEDDWLRKISNHSQGLYTAINDLSEKLENYEMELEA